MRVRPIGLIRSPHLGIVSVITTVTAFGYVGLLDQQGSFPDIDGRIALVLALLIGFAISSGIGAFTRSVGLRAVIAATCATGLLSLGFLALFSIGLVLMAAGALALVAWGNALRDSSDHRDNVRSVAAAIAMPIILAVGLVATG